MSGLKVWQDPACLATYTRTNVDEYRRAGIPRLHRTRATGGITRQDRAGEHALATLDPRGEPPSPALRPQVLGFPAISIEETPTV
jgi:hypothetical protein